MASQAMQFALTADLEQKIKVEIPTFFCRVKFPENDVEAIRKELSKYDKKVVLIADEHRGASIIIMGKLRVDPQDKECYYLGELNFDRTIKERRQWYNDVVELYTGRGIGIDLFFL